MRSHKRLRSSLKVFSNRKENKEEIFSGELGIPQNGRKIVAVPNRSGYVYVRLLTNKNELVQALNASMPLIYGLAVKIKRVKNTYTVIGKDYARYSNNAGSSTTTNVIPMPNHGGQHSLNPGANMGSDTVWVYSRQFMPMLSFPSGTSMTLGTVPYFYEYNNQWYYPQTTGTPSLASYLPTITGSSKMVLYWLDARDNSYQITAGNAFSNSITNPAQLAQYIPAAPDGYSIPLVAVRLETGTTSLDWNNIYDVRPFLQICQTGSTGGGTIYAQDEGVTLGAATTFNFVGDNVSASISGTVVRVYVTGSASGAVNPPITGSIVIFDDNTIKGSATQISFGSGLSAVTSGTTSFIDVTDAPTQIVSDGIVAWDEGSVLGTGTIINFRGDNVVASISGTVIDVYVTGSAGISSPWTQVVDESGSSISNFTAAAGTWISSGTFIRQTDTAATPRRLKYNTMLVTSVIIYEAEIQIRSAGTDRIGGLIVGFDGTNAGAAGVRLNEGTNQVQFESDSTASLVNFSATINTNTWYKVRMVLSGGIVTAYLDGTIIGSGGNNMQRSGNASYIGFFTYQAEVWFRNIKAWNLSLPT